MAAAGPAAASSVPAAAAFPIVGIGASAGGLAAFEAFFSGMPADSEPDMAFVIVQHLAPDHKSILVDLIQHYTHMQVLEVEDEMVVRPNCVYIIPPGCDMGFLGGSLHLMEPAAPRGLRLPIDFFFRSLAQDQRERAICVVLSGTGSDGTQGVRAIKGEGGLVIVQTLNSAEYDGMPRSAIATGLVDFELTAAEMANQLIAYVAHAFSKAIAVGSSSGETKAESLLKKVFLLLRSHAGHDFSRYKPSTIYRRIERRMAIHRVETLEGYILFLQKSPAEVEALFRDLLIGVTSFFRDPEAFKVLEDLVIPKLFAGKKADSVIRIWIPGCSTGEEAYSIAILLAERQEAMKQSFKVQIFATDIDSQAIVKARSGIYPVGIAADLTSERLARFFSAESDAAGYHIHKGIRDMLVFSEQDVIKDPPFSKLDFISCRNLLIYFGEELQRITIPLFQYALKDGGFLFLGTSETVGEFRENFSVLDRKQKLYRRGRADGSGSASLSDRFVSPISAIEIALPRSGVHSGIVKRSLREIAEQAMLRHLTMTGALINDRGEILYLHGRAGLYLEPASGEVGVYNIMKMAREGLRNELGDALRLIVAGGLDYVRRPGIIVKTNGDYSPVNLAIYTIKKSPPEVFLFLVTLEEAGKPEGKAPQLLAQQDFALNSPEVEASIAALRRELRVKEDYLQATNEELETANEEFKSSNEEMQSINEELQSTNEELETSKEELQSVNEELATVNAELLTKVADMTQVSNDMDNLLAGTGIATVFVDHNQRILRFTPHASRVINLISSDQGRPLGHIVTRLVEYDRLTKDIQGVLDSLIPKEVEVRTLEGEWYALRIQPYRTQTNVIEGAVVSFMDISAMKQTSMALAAAHRESRLAVVLRDASDAITVQNLMGDILAWNPGAVRLYGWSEEEALALNVHDRIPEEHRSEAMSVLLKLSHSEVIEGYATERLAKDGSVIKITISSTALVNEMGVVYAIATTERKLVYGGE
ncbi:MAG: chemotaxis protein CheB [Spirochaetota bacterium]